MEQEKRARDEAALTVTDMVEEVKLLEEEWEVLSTRIAEQEEDLKKIKQLEGSALQTKEWEAAMLIKSLEELQQQKFAMQEAVRTIIEKIRVMLKEAGLSTDISGEDQIRDKGGEKYQVREASLDLRTTDMNSGSDPSSTGAVQDTSSGSDSNQSFTGTVQDHSSGSDQSSIGAVHYNYSGSDQSSIGAMHYNYSAVISYQQRPCTIRKPDAKA
ncbi:uncharacterized protein LOC134609317 [Pelobates fuscus]|uniref:uncharacterized protein LOC134609317 n=1 Tax=Pelobates fuscus TaxID=191477 RepID=UPI002FE47514